MTLMPDPIEPPPVEPVGHGIRRRAYTAAKSTAGAAAFVTGILGVGAASLVGEGINWNVIGYVVAAVLLVWVVTAWVQAEREIHAVSHTFSGYYQRVRDRLGYFDLGPNGYGVDPGYGTPFHGGNGGQGGNGGTVRGTGNANGGNGGHGGWPGGAGGGGGAGGTVEGRGDANGGDGGNGGNGRPPFPFAS
ncbi:hypothetical protein [Rhodococcus rhodochrous]|uniref:hypothetical protein n=1 Tax=Rhodococcus rhodochrous TaxID=1829 RepID=UPI001E2A963C|nr:hypothetical protein [Rhodococcus rhodochrous]